MLGARLAARTVLSGAPLEEYEARYRAMLRDITRLTDFLLRRTLRPKSLARAMDRLARRPAILQKLLGVAAGAHRWGEITLRERLFLGTGL